MGERERDMTGAIGAMPTMGRLLATSRLATSRKAFASLLALATWLLLGLANAHAGNTVTKVTLVMTDLQGNVLMTKDTQGHILARYTYQPYGTQQSGPTNKGPGYTGHVNDPATGLVYMQQRYYDPDIGRFISPDPVAPTPGNTFNFGRYTYANDNPIRNIDPDGRAVQFAYESGSARASSAAMFAYLKKSPTFRKQFLRIKNSKITYTIMVGGSVKSQYFPTLKRIYINPKVGMKIKSSGKIQSPSIAGAHEIAHAADNDRLGDKKFKIDSNTSVLDANGVPIPKDDVEEERATRIESTVAKELGEPTRKSYTDAGPDVTTCGPTSNNVCQN
jgi:RHS repeat-associated protein